MCSFNSLFSLSSSKSEIKTIIKKIYDVDYKKEITDDEIIEFLRSLIFAHPCDTGRAGFLFEVKKEYQKKHISNANKKEPTLYSPWTCYNKNSIKLRIYYSEQMYDLSIQISEMKDYVKYLFSRILELKDLVVKEAEKDC